MILLKVNCSKSKAEMEESTRIRNRKSTTLGQPNQLSRSAQMSNDIAYRRYCIVISKEMTETSR